MLKFSKKPVKKVLPKKGILLKREVTKVVIQEYAAIDQFRELPDKKRAAEAQARTLGHDLLPWHERANDPAGRWNAFCASCNKLVVVCTETPKELADIYGHAFTDPCR